CSAQTKKIPASSKRGGDGKTAGECCTRQVRMLPVAFAAGVFGDAHAQGVQFDEATGVDLVVGAAVVVERGDGLVEQGVGGIPAYRIYVALVELDPHPAIDGLLGMVDEHLQGLAFG